MLISFSLETGKYLIMNSFLVFRNGESVSLCLVSVSLELGKYLNISSFLLFISREDISL